MVGAQTGVSERAAWNRVALVLGAALLLGSVYAVISKPGSPSGGAANLDRLVTDLELRVRDDPQNAELRLSIALAYLERGLHRDAIAQFEQALVLSPDQPTALIGLGRAHQAAGDQRKAREAYQRVADLYADRPGRYAVEQLGSVYFELGQMALMDGDAAAARDWLNESLKVSRTDADALRSLGIAQSRLGNTSEAESAFFAAVRLVPNYREVYEALEAMYTQAGDKGRAAYAKGMIKLAERAPQDGLVLLEQAAKSAPNVPQIQEGLALAYEGVGRKDEALAAYLEALRLDPDMFLSNLAVQRLTDAGAGR